MDLRPFQIAGIAHAVESLRAGVPKQGYSAPTGVGKSVVELEVQRLLGRDECYIVTPREEIVAGMMDKYPDAYNIWTPITLRNRLLEGAVPPPKYLVFDETHHHEASSWNVLDLLSGLCPSVGYTASFYRGTPKGTRAMLETWGEPIPLITYPEAVEAGYIRFPDMQILPLVDDDIVDVSAGDFSVTSLEAATVDRLADLAEHARRWYNGSWDMATVFGVPSSMLAVRLQQELGRRGLPAAVVTAATPRAERPAVFDAVEACVLALIHVDIVSEGVDRKFRRYVDGAPTLSPVKWVQRVGRIMRPWDQNPQYVCTNRNVLRHAYILEGCVPISTVAESDKLFGPTKRGHSRVLGMEAIGRFKPASVETTSGVRVHVYNLSTLVNNVAVEFCCLLHPTREPIWAAKVNTTKDGVKTYGNWCRCEEPTDLRGFASASASEPTEKQLNWWNRSARSRGLRVDQPVDKKSFAVLPVLFDVGERL